MSRFTLVAPPCSSTQGSPPLRGPTSPPAGATPAHPPLQSFLPSEPHSTPAPGTFPALGRPLPASRRTPGRAPTPSRSLGRSSPPAAPVLPTARSPPAAPWNGRAGASTGGGGRVLRVCAPARGRVLGEVGRVPGGRVPGGRVPDKRAFWKQECPRWVGASPRGRAQSRGGLSAAPPSTTSPGAPRAPSRDRAYRAPQPSGHGDARAAAPAVSAAAAAAALR